MFCLDVLLSEILTTQPKAMFVSPELKSKLSSILDKCTSLKRTIVFGTELVGRQRMLGFNLFIRNSRVKEWNMNTTKDQYPAADAADQTNKTVSRAKL